MLRPVGTLRHPPDGLGARWRGGGGRRAWAGWARRCRWPGRVTRSRCSSATPRRSRPTADAAFEWDRRGAPQVRHSHAFLARLRNLLARPPPRRAGALLDAGATEMRFVDRTCRRASVDRLRPRPGDEDLVALACRRTTFEWVLRRRRAGRPARAPARRRDRRRPGLRPAPPDRSVPPTVTGVVHLGGRAHGSTPTWSWWPPAGASTLPAVARRRRHRRRGRRGGRGHRHRLLLALLPAARRRRCRPSGRADRRRPRLPQVRGVPGRQPHVLGHPRRRPPTTTSCARCCSSPRRSTPRRAAIPATARLGRRRAAEPITEVHVMAGCSTAGGDFVVDDGAPAGARACTPSATRTRAPTRSTGGAAHWPWCRRRCCADALAAHPDDLDGPGDAPTTQADRTRDAALVPRPRSPRTPRPGGWPAPLLAGEDPDGDPDDPGRSCARAARRPAAGPAHRRRRAPGVHALVQPALGPGALLATDPEVGAHGRCRASEERVRPAPSSDPPRDELLSAIEGLGPAA